MYHSFYERFSSPYPSGYQVVYLDENQNEEGGADDEVTTNGVMCARDDEVMSNVLRTPQDDEVMLNDMRAPQDDEVMSNGMRALRDDGADGSQMAEVTTRTLPDDEVMRNGMVGPRTPPRCLPGR